MASTTHVLTVNASGRHRNSVTRTLSDDLVAALSQRHGDITLTARDLADGVGFVDDAWIAANFKPDDERSDQDRAALTESDGLVEELVAADVIVVGAPMYNFGVPAVLKAWVDQVARARLTFRYTENGPVGLLEGKRAFIIVSSAGVPVDSAVDFATPYLRHALSFVGITDVDVIAADQHGHDHAAALDHGRARIADLIHTQPAGQAA